MRLFDVFVLGLAIVIAMAILRAETVRGCFFVGDLPRLAVYQTCFYAIRTSSDASGA
jgi:hypothetical protein